MQKRHLDGELYFREQSIGTQKYVIPYIEAFKPVDENSMILEIGCGEGGNLLPFLDRGCQCKGIDISENKIRLGKEIFLSHKHHSRIELLYADIYTIDPNTLPKFDIIFLRDVIEHLPNQDKFMGFVKQFLKDDGVIFFAFPPWRMPFGGHQQILKQYFLSKMPFYHILPTALYKGLLKIGGAHKNAIAYLLETKQTGISIARFRKIVKKNQYVILKATDWLINPNYEIKFRLKPRKLVLLNKIPFFRDFFTTCYYAVIAKKQQ